MPVALIQGGRGPQIGPPILARQVYDPAPPVRKLGDGLDLASRTSYTTTTFTASTNDNGTYRVTNGRPVYIFYQSTLLGGPATPTVTCSNGQTLTQISDASDPDPAVLSLDKRKHVFAFIPNADGLVTFTFNHGAQTMTEARWYVLEALSVYTAEGILGTIVTDSAYGTPSNPNASSLSLPVQAVVDPNNTMLGFLWGGNGQLTTSGNATNLGDTVPNASATTTMAVYYNTGDIPSGAFDMSWSGTFSNGAHYLELRGIASVDARIHSVVLGTPLFQATVGKSFTYNAGADISPAPNALLLLAIGNARATLIEDVSSIAGTLGLAWTLVGSIVPFNTIGTPTEKLFLYQAKTGANPPTGTVVVNYATNNQSGQNLIITQHTSTDGTTPVVQSAVGSNDGSTTPTAILGTFADPLNGTYAAIASNPSGAAWHTPGMGYVELQEGRHSSPNTGLAVEWRHSADTTPDSTIASAPWGFITVEIKSGLITNPGTIDQSGVLFAPQANQQVRGLGLIDSSGSLFAPMVALSVAPGLVDSSGSTFAPAKLNQAVAPSLIDSSGTLFAPQANQQVRGLGLIDQSATSFGPKVTTSVAPGIIDSSGSTFAPAKLNQVVAPGLLDQHGVPFGPQANQQVRGFALLDQHGVLFTPTVVLATPGVPQVVRMTAGNLSEVGRYAGVSLDEVGRYVQGGADEVGRYVLPSAVGGVGLIDQSATLFAPLVSVEQDVSPSLIDQHGVLFGPQVNRQVLPGLVDRHGVLFNPTMSVGTVSVALSLIDQSGTAFSPTQVNQQVVPGVVDQSGVAFGPSVNQAVSPGIVDSSGSAFGPTVRQAVAPGLVDQHGVLFGPTVASVVKPGIVDSSGTPFGPSVAQQVRLALLDQSGTSFGPSVGLVVSPALLDQHGVLFGPSTRGQVAPGTIDQSGSPFAFSVGGGVKPGIIDQSGVAFTPKVNAAVGPGTIDQSGVVIALQQLSQKAFAALIDQHGQAFAPSIVLAPPQVVSPGRIDRTGVAFAPQRVHTVVVEDVAKTALAEPGVSKVALLDPGASEPR